MRREFLAHRQNCRPVIAYRDGQDPVSFISLGEASRETGLSKPAIRKAITSGNQTYNGYFFDEAIQDLNEKHQKRAVLLSFSEVEELYQLLKQSIMHAALSSPYKKNYSWPLYDEVVKVLNRQKKGYANESRDEYEYWCDWQDKNREDLCDDEERYR